MGMLGIVSKKLAERKSDRLQRAVDDPTLDTGRVLYHWTEAEDIQQLKPSTRGKLGPGIYALPEPKSGQRYVDLDSGTANVLPLYARGPIAKAADTDKASEQAIINLGGRDANVGGRAWGAETNRVLQEQGFTGREVGGAQPEINVFDSKDLRSVHAQFKDPTSKNILAGSAATAVGVGAMSQSNRTLAGTHPGDNADMSGLTLIPEMVSTVINDVYKYGKQAVTGKQDDGRLMETPESEGDAVKIKDAISKVADWGLNYRGAMGGPSGMDIIEGAMDAYTGTIRPALTSALGDAGTKRLEATGMLASMLLPAKNAKGALDIPEVDRDTKLLQRVGDPKSVNSLDVEFEEGPALLDNPMVKAEDIVNRPYVAGMSDTSRGALETLKSISGSEYNVLMEGGQDYMRQLRNANKGALWASDAGAITGMMNNAKGAMQLPGAEGSPLFFPYQMGGKSTDFATMTTDIMVPYAQRNMSKKDKKLVDKRIRDGAGNMLNDFTPQPDWPGVDSPKAMDWLKQAGTGRKAVVKALDEFRGEGSLNASQARAMIVDPTQINPKVANLQNVGQFDMSRDPMPGQHSTYNTDIMGNHLGRFGEGMNLLTDLNPVIRTSGKDFKQEMIRRGHNLEAEKLPAPVGKTMMPGLVGVLDERTVEELVKKGFVSP
jgi:hypothetical protein